MAGLLTNYLRATCGRKFEWGADRPDATDCYWWLIGWLEASRGLRAAALRGKYLGKYDSALGCARVVAQVGGMGAVLAEAARAAGLAPLDELTRGAVAVVGHADREVLGIGVDDERAAVLGEVGLIVARFPALALWG